MVGNEKKKFQNDSNNAHNRAAPVRTEVSFWRVNHGGAEGAERGSRGGIKWEYRMFNSRDLTGRGVLRHARQKHPGQGVGATP